MRVRPSAAECASQPHVGREIILSEQSAPLIEQLRSGEVALTFDDGPHDVRTPRVLNVLAAECIQASFFPRGDRAAKYPELAQQIVKDGHLIGSHTLSHARLIQLSPEEARDEITRGMEALTDAVGSTPDTGATKLFRFTYLQSNDVLDAIVDDLGLIAIGANALGHDYGGASSAQIVENVETALSRNGNRGIVLLHDPYEESDRILEQVLASLKSKDYQFVRVRLAYAGSESG
nr:polysaccharide deacetylase family protein [Hyphomonas sp. Mor2]